MIKIASSGSKEGLTKLINEFFYSQKYTIGEDFKIIHPEKNINEHFFIIQRKNRYL